MNVTKSMIAKKQKQVEYIVNRQRVYAPYPLRIANSKKKVENQMLYPGDTFIADEFPARQLRIWIKQKLAARLISIVVDKKKKKAEKAEIPVTPVSTEPTKEISKPVTPKKKKKAVKAKSKPKAKKKAVSKKK